MDVYKQEFKVRDLPTRSVTLFPTRAQVVRDIKDVVLQPGANQITVVGFSPTVDDSSIKVEGTGSSAIISDIAVELLPNREIFEDIYPESDSDSDSESDAETDEELEDAPALKAIRAKLHQLQDEKKRAEEVVSSASSRLKILDAYGKMLDRKRNIEIDAGVETYRAERAKVFADHMEGIVRIRELADEIDEVNKEEARLVRQKMKQEFKINRARAKKRLARQKEKNKVLRRKQERIAEKRRVKAERARFWARQCFSVRITIDAPSFTPGSSRRSSVASLEFAKQAAAEADADADVSSAIDSTPTVDLAISYVTASAGWSPTYDLQLSTTKGTGQLCFDASLTNTTSEAWSNCKVILSTSQTTFTGLNDTIPVLIPWKVKLFHGRGTNTDDLLRSREEQQYTTAWRQQQQGAAVQPRQRDALFGLDGVNNNSNNNDKNPLVQNMLQSSDTTLYRQQRRVLQELGQKRAIMQQQSQQQVQSVGFGASSNNNNNNGTTVGFGNASSGSLFGAPAPPAAPLSSMAAPRLFTSKAVLRSAPANAEGGSDGNEEDFSADLDLGVRGDIDGATILPETAEALAFQESVFEETGLTSTYDLPGLKTLAPSATASKQRVARISFAQVVFSHTIVAKYKPAAYLKAKLKNTSKITILKGPAGLTIDGSFMGRTTLPRCAPGDMFPLNLGVDPAIRVAYPKPDVKRATTGFLSKENSNAYKRSIIISNTRAVGPSKDSPKPVSLLVLDQVPVSEDDKLRVEIQQPRGITVGGAAIAAGTGTLNAASATGPGAGAVAAKDWGSATAELKKAGEVVWEVKLNPGRTVKLALEYDVGVPVGESVQQC